ncbi:MAG: hypothetical protein FKY71_18045 [Spiribacter salinus]|uniref:Phage terminase small subunit P27 family n=1 Tax=Spiribacter salinus TaxID=1335746 RepID=A0A540VAF4_9GAMM|nr:MAG: hypothetical protein FKY71_18045 [Spiribacter salinus]
MAVAPSADVQATYRPYAPAELTKEQAAEWNAIVDRMPADWFPKETHGLLAQYCRHVVAARHVSQLIEQHEQAGEFDIDHYDKLLKMQEREGRAASSLATRMRLTQQATYSGEKSKGKNQKVTKPWES